MSFTIGQPYDFPNSGKSLAECLEILSKKRKPLSGIPNGERLRLALETAVESLRDSPPDMILYTETLARLLEKPGHRNGESREIAYEILRQTINRYDTKEIHDAWNLAVPELRTAGRCTSQPIDLPH